MIQYIAGYMIGTVIASILGVIVLFVIEILIFLFFYKDMKKRNVPNVEMWLIFIALTGIVGWFVYFFGVRKDHPDPTIVRQSVYPPASNFNNSPNPNTFRQ